MSVTEAQAAPDLPAPADAPPRAADPELTHREILEILVGLLAALFTAMLSSTIVSNALPTIIADLQGSQTQYTWVITASLLATTVSTPVWGKLSDLISKKLLVQLAIVLFVIGSALAGMAHNVPFLIGARVLQGLAMGGLMALAQAIIGAAIPPRDRGRYSGYMGAVVAVATVSGPLLGGVIVDTSWLGWRWCFYVCVPLAMISLVVLQRYLHLPLVKRKVRMDYLGAILISGAASLPLVWVSFAGTHFPWWSRETAYYLGGTALLAILAVVVETRAKEPLVPLSVVRERTTALAIVASLAVGLAMFGSAVFLGQYFQIARGYSATESGLLTIPMMLGSFFGSVGAGQMITRYGKWKRYLVLGGLLLIGGLGVLGTIDHTTEYWYLAVGMGAMGLGMGMLMQNLVLAVQNTVDVSQVGAASASVTFFRSLGGAVGVSVLGAVLASRVTELIASNLRALGPEGAEAGRALQDGSGTSVLDVGSLPPQLAEVVRHAYGDATSRIFLIAAAAGVVSLLAVLFIREVPLRRTVAMSGDGDDAGAGVGAQADLAAAAAPGAASTGVVPEPTDDAERDALVALGVITSAERTALEREREATERVAAAATVIRQMRTDVADLFTRVDQQIADLERTLPVVDGDHPMAPVLNGQPQDGAWVDELRRYELSVLSASQRTADHLRETAKSEAEEIVSAARTEEEAIRQRIAGLQAVEQQLLSAVRDGLSETPPPPPAPAPAQPVASPPAEPVGSQAAHPMTSPPAQPGVPASGQPVGSTPASRSAQPTSPTPAVNGHRADNGYPSHYESEQQAFG
ncbi:MFS transporter [Kribbella sp. DT2]|uniref:MDR family MFS transporter n=1 Tax=Kribbella sp. DT2 TaxID=3393427 RepID=UPI003CF202DC